MQYQKCLLFCKSYYFLNVSKVVWFIVFMMNPFLTVIKTYSFVSPEAATRGVLYEKVFLEISRSCLRPATLLKKRLWHKCFPVNFVKFLRRSFLQSTSGGVVLLVFLTSFGNLAWKVVNDYSITTNRKTKVRLNIQYNSKLYYYSILLIQFQITPFFINNQKFKQSPRKSLIC